MLYVQKRTPLDFIDINLSNLGTGNIACVHPNDYHAFTVEDAEHMAHLFAEAPNLLRALKEAVKIVESYSPYDASEARAIIKRAEH